MHSFVVRFLHKNQPLLDFIIKIDCVILFLRKKETYKQINLRSTAMKKVYTLKVTTLALTVALGIGTMSVQAIDAYEGYESESSPMSNDWQTPLAAEFSRLDTSGNGLVLPNEASKNKAFNKKTFAAADADHDGTIDQTEYIQYKSVTAPQDAS